MSLINVREAQRALITKLFPDPVNDTWDVQQDVLAHIATQFNFPPTSDKLSGWRAFVDWNNSLGTDIDFSEIKGEHSLTLLKILAVRSTNNVSVQPSFI